MGILNQIKKYSVGAIVASLLLGLLFLIFPDKCITYMSLAVGIAFIIMGIIGTIQYFSRVKLKLTLALSITTLIVGIIVCLKYQAIISIIVVVLGVFILTTGIFNLVTSIKVITSSLISGWLTMLLSVVTIIFGIMAITKSSQLSQAIVQLIGVGLIVYAVLDIFAYFQVKNIAKKITEAVNVSDSNITDVDDYVEVDDNSN